MAFPPVSTLRTFEDLVTKQDMTLCGSICWRNTLRSRFMSWLGAVISYIVTGKWNFYAIHLRYSNCLV
jgi:hypothetical protein